MEIAPEIFWTGVIDWSVRNFHGYTTEQGTSYNSYLIMDHQPTLVDTVSAKFFDEYITRLTQLIQLDLIKYMVVLHAEGDHSSALPLLFPYLSTCTFVCTKKCQQFLLKLYPTLTYARFMNIEQFKNQELNIGQRTLKFAPQPMLHWPEQMFCLIAESRILFSSDAFGSHVACAERWAEDLLQNQVIYQQKEYLANIIAPYQHSVQRAVEFVDKYHPTMILPAHGVGFKNVPVFTQVYRDFAQNQHVIKKIVILYETMHGGTQLIAKQLAEGVISAGFQVQVLDMKVTTLTKLAAEAYDCCGFLLGSATFNNTPMSGVFKAMNYLSGLTILKNKPCMGFYCYGWVKTVGDVLIKLLEGAKGDVVVRESCGSNFRPADGEWFEQGVKFAERIGWQE